MFSKRRPITGFAVLATLGAATCIHSFFDAYLKGAGVSRLNISSPHYPEIDVLE